MFCVARKPPPTRPLYLTCRSSREMQRLRQCSSCADASAGSKRSTADSAASIFSTSRPLFCAPLLLFNQIFFSLTLLDRPTVGDVLVVTSPKCGTTWVQQIVHQLRSRGSMDFEEISVPVPWIEMAHDLGMVSRRKKEGRNIRYLML